MESRSARFNLITLFKVIFLGIFLAVSTHVLALPAVSMAPGTAANQVLTKRQIKKIIKESAQASNRTSDRLILISEKFLGVPFKLGPLGEGAKGDYDRDPLIRFDYADCTTYVETVMALALANNYKNAQKILQKIRYKDGVISYVKRNHFASVDWIANNQKAGFIDDITAYVSGDRVAWAEKKISKKTWYEKKTVQELSGFEKLNPQQLEELLKRWRQEGKSLPDETARLAYLPVENISEKIKAIPSGAIFNLVRENAEDKPDLISHQGFIIQKPEGTFVRQASWDKFVEDIPLMDYVARYKDSKWKLLGLNFNYIREP